MKKLDETIQSEVMRGLREDAKQKVIERSATPDANTSTTDMRTVMARFAVSPANHTERTPQKKIGHRDLKIRTVAFAAKGAFSETG